jgi:hypothetical protein
MSENRILRLKSALRLEWRVQNGQDEKQQPDHPSFRDSVTSSTQITFSVRTTMLLAGYPPSPSHPATGLGTSDDHSKSPTSSAARLICAIDVAKD